MRHVLFAVDPFTLGPIFGLVVVGIILYAIVQAVAQWSYNSAQPVLTVPARIVAKRTDVRTRHSHHGSDAFHHHDHTSTHYYVTFEANTGTRWEFGVDGQEFGLLVEGDSGDLSYQGSWYKGFVRR